MDQTLTFVCYARLCLLRACGHEWVGAFSAGNPRPLLPMLYVLYLCVWHAEQEHPNMPYEVQGGRILTSTGMSGSCNAPCVPPSHRSWRSTPIPQLTLVGPQETSAGPGRHQLDPNRRRLDPNRRQLDPKWFQLALTVFSWAQFSEVTGRLVRRLCLGASHHTRQA